MFLWQVYSSCEQSYRLTESGNINVPPEHADQYCRGPCFSETNLVLNCIDNILSHFLFYNRASIEDVRETIKAGCSYGPERGKNISFSVIYSLWILLIRLYCDAQVTSTWLSIFKLERTALLRFQNLSCLRLSWWLCTWDIN